MATWTLEQQQAIENRDATLLISAAAGSGKTAVLVEHVLQRLIDPVQPIDVDALLLVTFTNAAAGEMRARIAQAISQALAADPHNDRLRKQLFLVHRAQIMTVHAFCQRLAREQAAVLGIAPDFRLMDDLEGELLRGEVLEEVLEAGYQAEQSGFLALSDLLTNGRDDSKLGEVVLSTYLKIQAHPDPKAFLERMRRGLYAKDMNTPHAVLLREQAKDAVRYGCAVIQAGLDELDNDPELDQYVAAFESDLEQAQALLHALEQESWKTCMEQAQGIRYEKLSSPRGYEDQARLTLLKAWREEWKSVVKAVSGKWLTVSEEDALLDRAHTAPALDALIDTVNAFGDAFAAAKRARNLADFNDLEHFAVQLLCKGDAPSELARSLSGRYAEILVDEYQDTNAVQDAIFRALSTQERNLFFVGDVKQSIYGFRLADPSIFLRKYAAFQDAETAMPGEPRRISLQQNFRSRPEVLAACNYIFENVMGERVGGLVYGKREALYPGAPYPVDAADRYRTELLLLNTKNKSEDDDKTALEADMVAERIATLLQEGLPVYDLKTGLSRPLRPSDVAILLRSSKGKVETFVAALERAGIAASSEKSAGLLDTSEVGTMVSLLYVIDNPQQDVELIGVLRSPLFGFTEQKLAEIRLVDRSVSFYEALCRAAQTDEDCALFLQRLDTLRRAACDLPVYRLLWRIYEETGAMGLYGALPNGARRQNNLLAFFERARSFEAQGYRGLFAFVRLLRGMQQAGKDFNTVSSGDNDGAVHVMTIHHSKGLEFPVVIVADCAKQFNTQDLKAPMLIDGELGFGCKCRDSERGIQYMTMERIAVSLRQQQQMISEELRVLYVAMTRAKEKLILTGATARLGAKMKRWSALAALPTLPQYAMSNVDGVLGWLIAPLLRHTAGQPIREAFELETGMLTAEPDAFSVRILAPTGIEQDAQEQPLRFEELPPTTLTVAPPYVYPNAYLSDLPSKMTATGLGHSYRAQEAAEQTPPPRREVRLRTPQFAGPEAALTPAERGTLYHLFMQFCDFAACEKPDGVRQELNRLCDKRILPEQARQGIHPERLEAFFASEFYHVVMRNNRVRREFKFSVLAPACRFEPVAADAPDEQVLLQGVVDVLIEMPDGFGILDFKTDCVSAASAAARAARYQAQLEAYAYAVTEVFSRKIIFKKVFFFEIATFFEV